jgi:hypothetical protein
VLDRRFFIGTLFSWIMVVVILYGASYYLLSDFWMSMDSVGFLKPYHGGCTGLFSFLALSYIAVLMMAKMINLLKRDARTKKTVFFIGVMFGFLFGLPAMVYSLFFILGGFFPTVVSIASIISFVIAARLFVSLSKIQMVQKAKE